MAETLLVVKRVVARAEAGPALALGLALALLLWPMPGMVLDLLLAASLAFSLAMVLLALLADEPRRLASFPEALVLSSLGRMALCLGVARRLLYDGQPGALVETLGRGMTAGGESPLTGLALLAILGTASFLVVTVGVMRLAEVAARFALDALPGRQMAIDSALAGGRLEAAEGRGAADRLAAESGFYGAMDGVARFLRGETLATAVIVLVTPLAALGTQTGGGVTGLWGTLVPLAVGHGVAILVPAMLAGAAAAVAVGRLGGGERGLTAELAGRPVLLAAVALVLLGLGLLPGMARAPWLGAAVALGAGAWMLTRRRAPEGPTAEVRHLEVRLGLGLMGLVAREDLVGRLTRLRAQLSDEFGWALEPGTVTDDDALGANDFALYLGPERVGGASLRPGLRMALASASEILPPGGTEAMLPDGTLGVWLPPESEATAAALGCRLLAPVEVLLLHVAQAWREAAPGLFDLQRTAELLEAVRATHPVSAAALEGTALGLTDVREVGRLLLAEGVPLGDRVSLVEGLAAVAARHHSPEALAEAVRPALARTLSRLVAPEGRAEVLTLEEELDAELARAVAQAGEGPVALPPARAAAWHRALQELGVTYGAPGRPGTLLCSEGARRAAGQLAREAGARLRVVCVEELLPTVALQRGRQLLTSEVAALAARITGGE